MARRKELAVLPRSPLDGDGISLRKHYRHSLRVRGSSLTLLKLKRLDMRSLENQIIKIIIIIILLVKVGLPDSSRLINANHIDTSMNKQNGITKNRNPSK